MKLCERGEKLIASCIERQAMGHLRGLLADVKREAAAFCATIESSGPYFTVEDVERAMARELQPVIFPMIGKRPEREEVRSFCGLPYNYPAAYATTVPATNAPTIIFQRIVLAGDPGTVVTMERTVNAKMIRMMSSIFSRVLGVGPGRKVYPAVTNVKPALLS